jgi:precorrin-2/cobalt-factor-2 C20-methyltransferase
METGGRLVGVGVGPGDPELVTAQAARVLRETDVVVAPSMAVDSVGRAESIVRQVAPGVDVERAVFVMAEDGEERARALRAAAVRLVEHLDAGRSVAFVTLGDPNIYSTFPAVAAVVSELRPDAPIDTVAGIMAFQDLAARAGTVLLDGRESMALVTALDGASALDAALDDPDRAIVIYKGGRHLPAIAARLADAGRLDGAVVGELLGLPGERWGPAKELADRPASYLATVIVPPVGRTASL